ncbi:hypothetical protein LptCag_0940 [Leptospirillum ferriphilum]|uniref:Uncharacterized protein n=1 Tax=Leptospirillum ferriphilum TaxID=178606 RepID=A0A094W9B8_9BACT|nr:hypothetical protein LptCag_0940 [Leptospirillum ferriphilum]
MFTCKKTIFSLSRLSPHGYLYLSYREDRFPIFRKDSLSQIWLVCQVIMALPGFIGEKSSLIRMQKLPEPK